MTKSSSDHTAKRLARLAAVQGLYQIALTNRSVADVLKDFRDSPAAVLQETVEGERVPEIDQVLFTNILTGVIDNSATLDEMIAGSFDAKVSADRIEILLRAILRSGAFELYRHDAIAAGVIINDYIDVTHAFFGSKEPGLVNAVLDKLAKNLR